MPDVMHMTAEELLGQMLAKEYYVIEYRPVLGPERFREKLREHLLYMIGLEKSGVLFLSGPLFDQEKGMNAEGMTIVRAASFADAEKIAEQEPSVLAGYREAKVRRWVVNEGRVALHVDLSNRHVVLG